MSSTRSSESALRSSWKEASIVTCSGSQPRRSTMMFLKSSKLSFWVSKSSLQMRSGPQERGRTLLYQSRKIGTGGRRRRGDRLPAGCELFHHPRQRAPGPDLHERVAPLVEQGLHARRPAHGRAKLHLHDVGDAIALLMWAPGEVGHHRQSRRPPLDAVEGRT